MPSRGRAASPPPPAPRPAPAPSAVAPAPAPSAMAPAAPQQPGMFKQMAAMAGGVAVGSAVGHVAGNAITGMMGGGGGQQQPDQYQQPPAPQQYQAPGQAGQGAEQGPCAWEIKSFIQCAQTQSDLTLCDGFNEALKQCKQYQGIN